MIIGGGVVSGPATESTNNNNEVQEVHKGDILTAKQQQQQRHKTISKSQMRNSKSVQKKVLRVWKQRTLEGGESAVHASTNQKNNDTGLLMHNSKQGMSFSALFCQKNLPGLVYS